MPISSTGVVGISSVFSILKFAFEIVLDLYLA